MDTIQDNIPIEFFYQILRNLLKNQRDEERQHENITQRQQLGGGDPMGLMTIGRLTQITIVNML